MCRHNFYRAPVHVDKIGLLMRHKHSLLKPEPIHCASRPGKLPVLVLL